MTWSLKPVQFVPSEADIHDIIFLKRTLIRKKIRPIVNMQGEMTQSNTELICPNICMDNTSKISYVNQHVVPIQTMTLRSKRR